MGLHARIAAEIRAQRLRVFRVEFAEGEAVDRSCQMRHERGGTRIAGQRIVTQRADRGEINAKCGMRIFRREKARDALAVFAGLLRFLSFEFRHAGACMGVEQEEGLFLLLQMLDHEGEDGVLHHVGEIAGVIGVTVVHARPSVRKTAPMPPRARPRRARAGTPPAARPAKESV